MRPDEIRTLIHIKGIVTVSLILACLGAAIPYGTATGPQIPLSLNWLELLLSGLAAVATVGLIVDFWRLEADWAIWWRTRGIAFMLSGTLWAILGVYVLLLPSPDLTLAWRLGHVLPDLGFMVLALTTWRYIVVINSRLRQMGAEAPA